MSSKIIDKNVKDKNLTDKNVIDREITRFIGEHHVMTLATLNGDLPYCANLFYAYCKELDSFVFTSSTTTLHGQNMVKNQKVAASIVLETKVVGKVRGLQICGDVTVAAGEELSSAKKSYLKRFPYAVFADLELWILRPNFLKLTDNRMGFGKKIIWNGAEQSKESCRNWLYWFCRLTSCCRAA